MQKEGGNMAVRYFIPSVDYMCCSGNTK